jgi:hypothetical protein
MKQDNSLKWDSSKDKEFYFATLGEDNKFIVYSSGRYAITEVELLSLIKILFVNGRGKGIGRKAISVYEDSTQKRSEITKERLQLIGVDFYETSKKLKKKIITR